MTYTQHFADVSPAHTTAAKKGHQVYKISLRHARPLRALLDDDKYLVDWNEGIDLRIDWNGETRDPGTFEALSNGDWTPLRKVSPGTHNEQLVSPTMPVTRVRVVRGPHHPGVRFAIKLIPIVWISELKIPDDHNVVVERGKDYNYAPGHHLSSEPWMHSQAVEGLHRLELNGLIVGQDYEMWARLWHPDGSDKYQDQDPVLRTDDGGGNTEIGAPRPI